MNASETTGKAPMHIEIMMYVCERVERARKLFSFSTFIANYFFHYFCWDFKYYVGIVMTFNLEIFGDKVHFPFLFVALPPPPGPHTFCSLLFRFLYLPFSPLKV